MCFQTGTTNKEFSSTRRKVHHVVIEKEKFQNRAVVLCQGVGWRESFVVCILWKCVPKWTEMQHGEIQNGMWPLVSTLQWQDLNRAFVQYLAHCSQGSMVHLGRHMTPSGKLDLEEAEGPAHAGETVMVCSFIQQGCSPTYQDASTKQRSFGKERAAPCWSWLWADYFHVQGSCEKLAPIKCQMTVDLILCTGIIL